MRAALLRCVAIKDTIPNKLEWNFTPQFTVFWLQTFKSQILVNAVYFGDCFLDAQYNPLIILCSATNVAFAFSECVRDKVVEFFQDCTRVDIVTI